MNTLGKFTPIMPAEKLVGQCLYLLPVCVFGLWEESKVPKRIRHMIQRTCVPLVTRLAWMN